MKKVIKGRRYDTDTAKCVGADMFGNFMDFAHWTERLYRKSTGEFFLYGEGGPMSKYSRSIGQETSGDERIMPLSYSEAQKWAEKHLSGAEYEEIFGEIDETGERQTIALSLTVGTVEKLKRDAAKANIGLSEYITSLINEGRN